MSEPVLNLLAEPLFGVRSADGADRRVSLPGAFAALGSTDLESFTALQAHQGHAWHAFLVQLAAIALHRAGLDDPVLTDEHWRELLLALTEGREEPWCLVVPDLSQPAFMQPPVPEGSLERFKGIGAFPDALDVLITTKNHDVKRERISNPGPEHWVFALVTLQTTQSYSGPNPPAGEFYWGVSRMNGGQGSRAAVGITPNASLAAHFASDVRTLMRARPQLLNGPYGFEASGGNSLLWLPPWDGHSSLSLEDCDPFSIEICRRIRLTADGSVLTAYRISSRVRRLDAASRKGDVGDPWIPIRRADAAALTISSRGFSYDLLGDLLLGGEYETSLASRTDGHSSGDVLLCTRALAGGEGQTSGYHERWLVIPARVHVRLSQVPERERIASRVKARVLVAQTAGSNVLWPALQTLFRCHEADEIGKARDRKGDNRPKRWLDRLDRAVDGIFFEDLWADLDADDEEAGSRWSDRLRQLARSELEHAIQSSPLPVARRYRAIAAAERVFADAWSRQFGPSLSNEHAE